MLASTVSRSGLRRVAGGLCTHSPAALFGGAVHPGMMRRAFENGGGVVQADAGPAPVFVSFDVYKGKGAMSIKPIPPTWEQLDKGGFRLAREGTFYIEMANAASSGGGGQRSYDWSKKVGIALNCLEVANILAEPNKEHNMYHDPNKGRQGEGQIRKTFKWTPKDDVYLLAASFNDKSNPSADSYATCSMTLGEFYMFKQLVNHAFIYLTGWDQRLLPR